MQVLGCSKCVSAVAILDYSGAEDCCARFAALAERARAAWRPSVAEQRAGCGALPGGPPSPVRGSFLIGFMFVFNPRMGMLPCTGAQAVRPRQSTGTHGPV